MVDIFLKSPNVKMRGRGKKNQKIQAKDNLGLG